MALVLYIASLIIGYLIIKIIYQWITQDQKLKHIPGPKGWPLVGNALQIDASGPHKTFTEWSKKYGSMFKVRIYHENIVILNDHNDIMEMLNSEACSSRPYIFRISDVCIKDWNTVSFGKFSPEWNENKKALTRSLNAYGSGLKNIESVSVASIHKLFEDIEDKTEQFSTSINLKPCLHICVVNIITTLFYGTVPDASLLDLRKYGEGFLKFVSPAGILAVLDLFPWMIHLPLKSIQEPLKDVKNLRNWINTRYWDNEKTTDKYEGIIDTLRNHVNKLTNRPFTPLQLMGTTFEIIVGGFLSTTITLYTLILVLINHPEIQEKLYEEIQKVTKGRPPQVSDRPQMSYMRAVMEEVFRFNTLAPLGTPHATCEDTTINGKVIPKGVTVMANLWALHHNEEVFNEPWEFKPERYLGADDGELLGREDPVWKHTKAFGAGRRICAGEMLARARLFVIATFLLQKYKFLPEDEHDIPSCDARDFESGLGVTPREYKVRVALR